MSAGEHLVVKYPRTPHLSFSPGAESDDVKHNHAECASLPILHSETILTEKLDGGNCSIYRGKVYARTNNQEATHESFGPIKQLVAQVSYAIPQHIQLFGENLFGVHSLEYDDLKSFLYIFAGLEHGNKWMSWDHLTELADEISIPMVPVVRQNHIYGSLQELESDIVSLMNTSRCGTCQPEGYVIRTVAGFTTDQFSKHVCKYVRAGHNKTDESWKRTWKAAKLNKI